MKKVTAVLPARNCRQYLHRCLRALCAGEYVPEIIVVDDGSDDRTRQMIEKNWPQVTCLTLAAHTGYAHAANAGLRLVRTQYAFLIRPDLQAGKKCIARLLEAMEQDPECICAVPAFLHAGQTGKAVPGDRRKGPGVREIIAVPDGCAMYRMRALEESGWLDERHYDGLEAFDLSLRAALGGWKSLQVKGAAVRILSGQYAGEASGRSDAFRRQLAAGNGMYSIYKNIPGFMRFLGLPLFAAADAAQISSFVRRGEFGAYRTGFARGRALCHLEKDRRAALEGGVAVWPENLSDASFLGMEEEAEKIYPLFLSEKEPVSAGRLARYLHIQRMLAAQLPELVRLLQ